MNDKKKPDDNARHDSQKGPHDPSVKAKIDKIQGAMDKAIEVRNSAPPPPPDKKG